MERPRILLEKSRRYLENPHIYKEAGMTPKDGLKCSSSSRFTQIMLRMDPCFGVGKVIRHLSA